MQTRGFKTCRDVMTTMFIFYTVYGAATWHPQLLPLLKRQHTVHIFLTIAWNKLQHERMREEVVWHCLWYSQVLSSFIYKLMSCRRFLRWFRWYSLFHYESFVFKHSGPVFNSYNTTMLRVVLQPCDSQLLVKEWEHNLSSHGKQKCSGVWEWGREGCLTSLLQKSEKKVKQVCSDDHIQIILRVKSPSTGS